jgi:hypothetical protein
LQDVLVPYRQEAPAQFGVVLHACGDLRKARPHGPADHPQNGSERDQIADIVGEFHRPPTVTRLAGGVNDHGVGSIHVVRQGGMIGEENFRRQQPNLALQLHGDSLPGAKMAGIPLRGRGGRQF